MTSFTYDNQNLQPPAQSMRADRCIYCAIGTTWCGAVGRCLVEVKQNHVGGGL